MIIEANKIFVFDGFDISTVSKIESDSYETVESFKKDYGEFDNLYYIKSLDRFIKPIFLNDKNRYTYKTFYSIDNNMFQFSVVFNRIFIIKREIKRNYKERFDIHITKVIVDSNKDIFEEYKDISIQLLACASFEVMNYDHIED